MTRRPTLAMCLLAALPLLGCGDDQTASQVGNFEESDGDLALKALRALGAKVDAAAERRCQECHSVSRAKVREWQDLTKAAEASGCMPKTARRYVYKPRSGDTTGLLAELNPTCKTREEVEQGNCYFDPGSDLMSQAEALALVDCLRTEPTNASSPFDPSKAGIHVIEAHERNSHFQRLFAKAFPDSQEALRQRTELVRRVKMPRGAIFEDQVPAEPDPSYVVAIKKEDFWSIREWFDRGLPALESTLSEEPGPTECKPKITDALRAYLKSSARKGWTFKNAVDALGMYGCDVDTLGGWPDTALGCLGKLDEAKDWEASYEGAAAGATVRVLRKLGFRTSFWTRSSADGRFVANGRSDVSGSVITDLVKGIDIPVRASYDPGFFPDNSTFVFQGTPVGAGFCPQDMLLNPPMANGELVPIEFKENGCGGTSSIRLYQHLGTSLDGNVSFAANGDYTSDNGGHATSTTSNPSATAGPSAEVTITPIVRNGIGYQFLAGVARTTPYEGDTAISPTTKLISARLAGPGGKQLGVTIRQVTLNPASGSYTVSLGEPSTVCIAGGKTAHSFDDRFMAVHSYSEIDGVGKGDISIVDLSDGSIFQVTNMPAGKFAIYPHFRSDGWLYFLVRDSASADSTQNQEYAAASDVALRIEKAKPINDVKW